MKIDFCNRIGITDASLILIVERIQLMTDTLERIANALNVPVVCFFDETDRNATNNNLSIDANLLKGENERLLCEISHLQSLLEEKERTINILLTK